MPYVKDRIVCNNCEEENLTTIDFYVYCENCNAGLCLNTKTATNNSKIIYIEPCEECLKNNIYIDEKEDIIRDLENKIEELENTIKGLENELLGASLGEYL